MSVETAGPVSAPPPPGEHRTASRQGLLVIAVVLGVFALVAGAYALGSRTNRHTTTVLSGTAYVGDQVASVRVGGWSYGVHGTVRWFDAQGNEHDDSWPACLAGPAGRHVPIRFGAVTVELPDGGRVRDIVWVDCS